MVCSVWHENSCPRLASWERLPRMLNSMQYTHVRSKPNWANRLVKNTSWWSSSEGHSYVHSSCHTRNSRLSLVCCHPLHNAYLGDHLGHLEKVKYKYYLIATWTKCFFFLKILLKPIKIKAITTNAVWDTNLNEFIFYVILKYRWSWLTTASILISVNYSVFSWKDFCCFLND